MAAKTSSAMPLFGVGILPLFSVCALILLLPGCVKKPPEATITPLPADIHGRLLATEPARRWQVMFDWHATSPNQGHMRLTHAFTHRIVELRWEKANLWLRDNQANVPDWRPIGVDELARHGISLLPHELAGFFSGHIPAGFSQTRHGQWLGKRNGNRIRVEWKGHRLNITDIKNGRQAIFIINDD